MTPDSEQWDQLQALFHLAEDTPNAGLDAILLHACPDEDLRNRARTLILAEREGSRDPESPRLSSLLGRIGPYTVVRHLGSGGVGAVYLVERVVGGAVQRSALKVLSLHAAGPMFTDRFVREQHILASLNHPHITRMLDAGVGEGGQPYLVMEYVEGVQLDAHCDAHLLSVAQCLELFLKVCEAVAYAHRNLVVHLDIKPSNILVTEVEGAVKLLDFGTSKLIQPDSLLTTAMMATPAYASPEQLRNEGVTTASDTYALGAVLFELLAGRRPNQDSSVAMMIERSIKELSPEPLPDAVTEAAAEHRGLTQARLRGVLTGDLATIVAKCLQSRPVGRYASVDALIEDLHRFLAGRPVLARPQTTTYRIAKFVRRNRVPVIAGTLATALLIASLGYAAWKQEEAVRAGRRALQMQTFMYQLFKLANSNFLGHPAATVPEFLQLGVRVIPDYIKDPADLRAAQLGLAESMFDNLDFQHAQPILVDVANRARLAGDIPIEAEAEGFAGYASYFIGKTALATDFAAHSMSLAHKPGVTPLARVWIEVFYVQNREQTGNKSDDNVALLQSAVAECRKNGLPDRELAWTLGWLANVLNRHGDWPSAERYELEKLAIFDREPYAVCDQADTYGVLGRIYSSGEQYEKSIAYYKRASEGFKACMGEGAPGVLMSTALTAQSMVYLSRSKDAVPLLEAAMPGWRKMYGSQPDLVFPLAILAQAYVETGRFGQAEAAAQEGIKVQEGKINPNSARVAICELMWARALAGEGRNAEALTHAATADREYAATAKPSPLDKRYAAFAHQLHTGLQQSLP